MRILHVTRETSADRRFGIGRSLQPVLQALRDRGHEVVYLTQEDLGPRSRDWQRRAISLLAPLAQRLHGEAGRLMATTWGERLNMGRLAAKAARRLRADAVHLHDPWLAWGFRQAGRWPPGASRTRWGLTEHGFGSYADATQEEGLPGTPGLLRRLRRLERRLLLHADWVICPTEAARTQLARDCALPAAPGHWQHVVHPRPKAGTLARAEARARLRLDEGLLHVLAIGRLDPVKRMAAVVKACLALQRPLRLTLLGAGDSQALRALLPQGSALELCIEVADDVTPFLAAADLYVSASRNESFGLANLEALGAGVPSVCTAVGGVPEVTGGAAWLVPGADNGLEESLARAMAMLLEQPLLARQLAERGAQRVAAWPDAAELAERLERIYRGEPHGSR